MERNVALGMQPTLQHLIFLREPICQSLEPWEQRNTFGFGVLDDTPDWQQGLTTPRCIEANTTAPVFAKRKLYFEINQQMQSGGAWIYLLYRLVCVGKQGRMRGR
jgi:hypothetical protein